MRSGFQSTDVRASSAQTYSSVQANSSVSPVRIDWEHARIPAIFPATTTTKSTISPPKRSARSSNNIPTKASLPSSTNDMILQSLASIQDPKKKAELLELAKSLQQIEQQKSLLLSRVSPNDSNSSHVHLTPVVSQKTSLTQERMTLRAKKTLDTDIKELTLCDCGEEIHPLDLRFHQEEECSSREVPCVRPGCHATFKAKDRFQHEKNECKFMLKNKKILQDAAAGEIQVECIECSQRVQQRYLKRHLRATCERRFVDCPHAEFGCHEQVRWNELREHEEKFCVVGKIRSKIAAHAVFVNEETICDWCQNTVKKRHLLDHQEEECSARERSCPNAHNGCREWVTVSKVDEHLRLQCCVTLERAILAEKAREKNTPIACRECGSMIKVKNLPKHWRNDCVSRLVPCKNAAHGCKAMLRWRDRHLHEDFRNLSKERSMLEFYGGNSYVSIDSEMLGDDLLPPWTIEFYVWLMDVKTELLQLMQRALDQMEILLLASREKDTWKRQSSALKKRLKDLKASRASSRGAGKAQGGGGGGGEEEEGGDFVMTAKRLAEDFDTAEKGIETSSKQILLSEGLIKIYILEAFRLFQHELQDKEELKQEINDAIYAQTQAFVQEKPLFSSDLLEEKEHDKLFDLTVWARDLLASSNTRMTSEESQKRAAKQKKLLSERAELIAQQQQQDERATTPQEKERLQRKLEREIGKLDNKIVLLNDNMSPELVDRSGRHVLLSSSKSSLCLMMKESGKLGIHQRGGSQPITFDYFPERNQWLHVVLSADPKDVALYINGQLKGKKKKTISLPIEKIGTSLDGSESFQGFLQEIRLWKSTRTQEEIQKFANDILPLPMTPEGTLVGYWTLEEGMGEFIDDASLSLSRSACFNTRWIEYTQPIRKRFGLPPTPSLRDKMCCNMNQKLKMLAQRARDRDRVVLCLQDCGEKIEVKFLEHHLRCFCVNRPVICSEVGCDQTYKLSEKTKHLKQSCDRYRLKEELAQKYKDKEIKEPCLLNCGEYIKRRHQTQHYQEECPNRFTTCPYKDCGETVVFKNVKSHTEEDCQSGELSHERKMIERSRQRQREREEEKKPTIVSSRSSSKPNSPSSKTSTPLVQTGRVNPAFSISGTVNDPPPLVSSAGTAVVIEEKTEGLRAQEDKQQEKKTE